MATEIYTKEEIDTMLKDYVKKDGSTPIEGDQEISSLTVQVLNTGAKITMKKSDEQILTLNANGITENRALSFPDASGEIDLSN